MSSRVGYVVLFLCCFIEIWRSVEASRILVVVPTPTYSHQAVFRPFTQELARRGHQVVVLTTDPAFLPRQAPQNLTEIDLHDISYKIWTEEYQKLVTGKKDNYYTQIKTAYDIVLKTFKHQMLSKEVRDILADKSQQFDLVVIESWVQPALALAHIYRTPAIMMNTLGLSDEYYEYMGGLMHPIIYPDIVRTQRFNLSPWEETKTLYNRFELHNLINSMDDTFDILIRDVFGENVPPIKELRKTVESIFTNSHPVWEGYRPIPLNWRDTYWRDKLRATERSTARKDLKSLMDSSKRGVIYMSFGSITDPSRLPFERLEVFARVFAALPYDVLWKWKDAPRSLPSNVHTFSWLPQPDLLRHEKLVLFITHGGLQSTDEALHAGVPLLGIPLMGDQWVNVENYERLGIGMRLDLYTFSESQLRQAIQTLIDDKSYRERSAWVGREMQDRAQSALARAVWGAERALRLRGRRMTTPPPALTWDGLLQALLLTALVLPVALIIVAVNVYNTFYKLMKKNQNLCKRGVFRARGYSPNTAHVLQRTS